MRKLLIVCGIAAAFSTLALAEDWTGRLVDATCHSTQQSQNPNQNQPNSQKETCDATSTTSMFALDVSGKIYKFDAAGNTKAAEALKSHADRSADPNQQQMKGATTARVSGTMDGDTLRVDSINVQ
jgi:hypothetical protein